MHPGSEVRIDPADVIDVTGFQLACILCTGADVNCLQSIYSKGSVNALPSLCPVSGIILKISISPRRSL